MVSLAAGAERVAELLAPFEGRVSMAAFNGPSATVVAGEPEALEAVVVAAGEAGVRARWVPVDYASHSAGVEAIRERLLTDLAPVIPLPSRIPVYSSR